MAKWRVGAAAALLAVGGAAVAQAPEQAVIGQLARQGYVEFEVSRTLLGRIRVVALGPGGERREIVFNPATGEILRDLMEGAAAVPRVLDRSEEPDVGAEAEEAVVSEAAPDGGQEAAASATEDGGDAGNPTADADVAVSEEAAPEENGGEPAPEGEPEDPRPDRGGKKDRGADRDGGDEG